MGRFNCLVLSAALVLAASAWAWADVVVLNNGDKLTGSIGQIKDGSMAFTSPVLGALTIKLSDIQSYQTTSAATVQLKDGQTFQTPIVQGTATQIVTGDQKTVAVEEIKAVNAPPEVWTGAVVFNGVLNRGNTNNETAGLGADAVLRRDNPFADDRFTLKGDYNYGNTGRGADKTTTTDNLDALVKYDKFITEKLYGYGEVGYLHDRIAQLNVQLTPGAGLGYQWTDKPLFSFNTEGGVNYVYEDYQGSSPDQKADYRLAYHLTSQLNPTVSLFNDAEYLAAFEDPADYLLNADAGIRADLTKSFFAQFKVLYRRNDRPAAGALKDDLTYLLGVGWTF